jgi:hypothetical protein
LVLVTLLSLLAAAACGTGGDADENPQRAVGAPGASPKNGGGRGGDQPTATAQDGDSRSAGVDRQSHGDADYRPAAAGAEQPRPPGDGVDPAAELTAPGGNGPAASGDPAGSRSDDSTGAGDERTTTAPVTPGGFTSDAPPAQTEEASRDEEEAPRAPARRGTAGPEWSPESDRDPCRSEPGGNACRDAWVGFYGPHSPIWVPDPTSMAYDRTRSGVEKVITSGAAQGFFRDQGRIAVIRADSAGNGDLVSVARYGGDEVQLTRGMSVTAASVGPSGIAAVAATMDRNMRALGRRASRTNGRVAASDGKGKSDAEIFAIRPDGKVKQLTDNKAMDTTPSWSPDGSRIAYASNQNGNFEIYVMDADGGNVNRLTDTKGDDFSPTWSPDSRRIAYAGNEDGDFDIHVMPADGGTARALTDNDVDDGYPTWSATQGIAFSRVVGDSTEVFIIGHAAAEAGEPGAAKQQLTVNDSEDLSAAWAPDGQDIVITRIRTEREKEDND